MGFALNLTKPFLWRFKLKLFMKSNGFTLIEILISIVILSISLLALAGLMATTTQNTSFGGHITEAATFAQDQLEQLRVTPWANIISGTNTIPGSTGIVYNRTWNVVPSGNLRTITITISWTDRVFHSFNLISAISQ
jgi:type IV pilus assembly protein PilV